MAYLSGKTLESVLQFVLTSVLAAAGICMNAQSPAPGNFAERAPDTRAARLPGSYGKLPISFEPNQGQTDKAVQFIARGVGYTLLLVPDEAFLSLHGDASSIGTH